MTFIPKYVYFNTRNESIGTGVGIGTCTELNYCNKDGFRERDEQM